MYFTLDEIARQFDTATLARGDSYARQGKVLAVSEVNGRLVGEVRGSGGQRYQQVISLTADRRGLRVDGHCSCPMYHNCKHVAAALIVYSQQANESAADGLPPSTQRWLEQWNQALAGAAKPVRAAPTLLYALTPDADDGTPRLNVGKARLRKNGSIIGITPLADLYSLLVDDGRQAAPADRAYLQQLAGLRAGYMHFDHGVLLSGTLAAQLVQQLCAAGRLYWAPTRDDLRRGAVVQLRPAAKRGAVLGWHAPAADGAPASAATAAAHTLQWLFDDGSAVQHLMATTPMLYVDGDDMGELALPASLAALPPAHLLQLVAQAPRLAPQQRVGMAKQLLEHGLDRLLPLPQDVKVRQRRDIAPRPRLLLDSLPGFRPAAPWQDYARLSFDYDGVPAPAAGAPLPRRTGDQAIEEIVRDEAAEQAFADQLAACGFTPAKDAAAAALATLPDAMQLPTTAAWLVFVRQQLPRLHEAGWHIETGSGYRFDVREATDWYAEIGNGAAARKRRDERAGRDADDDRSEKYREKYSDAFRDDDGDDDAQDKPEEGAGIDNAWFSLELGIVVDGRRHALLPLLLEMIRSAPAEFDEAAMAARDDSELLLMALDDNTRVALPWRRIKPILATLALMYFTERDGASLRLPLTDAARLAELEQAAQLRWVGGERLRALGRKLLTFEGIATTPLPQGLQAQLRPYQHAGLSWMQFLRADDFGGILADDMGLGKTIQTLAHILTEKEAGRLDRPALVVAPTSLMSNWQAEAARFTPGLRVLLLHGKERAGLFADIGSADLVLTTYALLGRDEAQLRQHRYHLLILDEAQYIKNSKAKAAQTARLLDARHRLCLTGTPVQNHLGELWSQFHFLMPGLLGDEKTFNAQFRKPIEQWGDQPMRALLSRRIKPFMLRRTKDKVATELPPKTEIMLPVELGAAQRDLYETVRVAMDHKVREAIDQRGLARSQIVILDALLKLRQVCCDPRLLKKQANSAGSAKLDTLMELMLTLNSEGRKVLIFSQFTSMLALIAAQLQERAIDFALLTGDTVDRAAQVAAFQGGQVSVFLISLKAGGVGLNLTAADTVIHYDPWWNPAAENQATDRAWRIGQEQPVFVYKLIARGTLEERIQDMQRRKGELANAIVDAEAGLGQAIGADDLQAIFAPL